jgi:hypothetical protein
MILTAAHDSVIIVGVKYEGYLEEEVSLLANLLVSPVRENPV